MKTLQTLLETYAANPTPAITIPQKPPLTISYTNLLSQTQHLQRELAPLALASGGSRVFIILPKSFEFIALFLTIACMRATAVPLNTLLKQDEYAFFLEELNPEAVIVPEGAFCGKYAASRAALDEGVGIVNSTLSSRGCHIRTIVRFLYSSNTQY